MWLRQFPKSNSEYNAVLLNKILFRRSFISEEGSQFTVAGTLLSLTKVTNPSEEKCSQKNHYNAEIVAIKTFYKGSTWETSNSDLVRFQ